MLEAAIEIAGLKAAQKRLQVAYSIEADVPKLLQGDPRDPRHVRPDGAGPAAVINCPVINSIHFAPQKRCG